MVTAIIILTVIFFLGHSLLAWLYSDKEQDSFLLWWWRLFIGFNREHGNFWVYGFFTVLLCIFG